MQFRHANSAIRGSSMLMESLEKREYFSAANLIPVTPGFIGPVQPNSQTTAATTSTTTKTTTPASTTTTTSTTNDSSTAKQFALYDTSFPSPGSGSHIYPGFQQAYWTGNSGMHNLADPSEPYASQKQINVIANLAKNGGTVALTGTVVHPGALTFLDFETDETEPASYYVQRLNWFHQADPGGKVGIWGLIPGFEGINRDIAINPNAQFQAQIAAQIKKDTPIINAMDVIIIPSYMLGPGSVDRDLQWITTLAGIYHKDFPGKPVLAWTWGAYHTAWNPVNDVLPTTVTQAYVQTCMNSCDGMIVWGPQADNNLLLQTGVQMVQPALLDDTLPPALEPAGAGNVGMFSNLPITSQLDSLLV